MATPVRGLRTREILDAALTLLHRDGYGGVTVRAIAEELGGSPTLLTHYFATQAELMAALLEYQLELFDRQIDQLPAVAGPRERLVQFVAWFLPDDAESLGEERARVNLSSEVGVDHDWVRPYLDRLEVRMTELLREHLAPLVSSGDLELATDSLRLALNGIVLSAVEHPDDWPAERQHEVVGRAIAALPLREEQDAPAT